MRQNNQGIWRLSACFGKNVIFLQRQLNSELSFCPGLRMLIFLAAMLFFIPAQPALSERIFFAGYKGGFYIRSEEEGGMELRLGGAFQSDYRYYLEDERADNRFDIRRARLVFRGQLTQWFRFGLEYEFQGNETKHLVDAYGEAVIKGLHGIRIGQFKEPFSLEWQTRDKGILFAERSMGYYLTPRRDIGFMAHGSVFQDRFNYALGIFNGDGPDGSSRGNEYDNPEIAGRVAVKPFKDTGLTFLDHFHIGMSATYAAIDLTNVNLEVKSTGMAGSDRRLYVLQQNTKFGRIYEAGKRRRLGLETAWSAGSVLIQTEYQTFEYTDLKPATGAVQDADFSTWYASIAWCVTGEKPVITGGVVKPIYPDRFFNPSENTIGAVCLAARIEHFSGDENWIRKDAYDSVETADGYSLAVNWILYPMLRIVFDYSHTDFSDPILVRRDPVDGHIDYINEENVFTFRFSIDF